MYLQAGQATYGLGGTAGVPHTRHNRLCLCCLIRPRLKLKQNWITGCYALGSSYIALPWLAGQCTFGEAGGWALLRAIHRWSWEPQK